MVPVGLLLAAPDGRAGTSGRCNSARRCAKSRIKLNTVSSPPRTAAPGKTFKITGKVTNSLRTSRTRVGPDHPAAHQGRVPEAGRRRSRCAASRRTQCEVHGQREAPDQARRRQLLRARLRQLRAQDAAREPDRGLPLRDAAHHGQASPRLRAAATPAGHASGGTPAARRPRRRPGRSTSSSSRRATTPSTRAGIAAIKAVADASARQAQFTVDAPAPADAPAVVHGRDARRLPRGRLPRHRRRQRAHRRPAGRLRDATTSAAAASSASARRSRPTRAGSSSPTSWARAPRAPRAARSPRRSTSPTGPRGLRGPSGVLGPLGRLLQLHEQRPRLLARARDRRRGSVRAAARRAAR